MHCCRRTDKETEAGSSKVPSAAWPSADLPIAASGHTARSECCLSPGRYTKKNAFLHPASAFQRGEVEERCSLDRKRKK